MMNRFLVNCTIATLVGMAMVGNVCALSMESGRLVVRLTEPDGTPITNAAVSVRTLARYALNAGGRESDYAVTSSSTDSNGVADVAFGFIVPDFTWTASSPSHYSAYDSRIPEVFPSVAEPSDYGHASTDSEEEGERLNVLRTLLGSGDMDGFCRLFEAKNVVYQTNILARTMVLYRRRTPVPMYMYGANRLRTALPVTTVEIETNGIAVAEYPSVGFDMKKGAFLPPFGGEDDDEVGEIADFTIHRYVVETNGVKTFYGAICFPNGGGAYVHAKTGNASFPSTYAADTNMTFMPRIDYQYHVSSNGTVSGRMLLGTNEYMVVRSRIETNSVGKVVGCNYSKIIGEMWVGEDLYFESSAFNANRNDPNLEADIRENLADGPGAETRWP